MQDIKILYVPINQTVLDGLIADGYEVLLVTDNATYLRKQLD